MLTFAILLTIAIYGGVYFSLNQIRVENKAISEVLNNIEFETAKQSKLSTFKSLLEETKDHRAAVATYVLENDGVVDFVETIEELGTISRATTTIFGLNESPLGKDAVVLNANIKLEGTWLRTYRILSLIESMPYALTVEKLVTSKDMNVKDGLWNTVITLRVLKNN